MTTLNNILENYMGKSYEKVLSTNNGIITFYPQSNMKIKTSKVYNKKVEYTCDDTLELNHKIKMNKKAINLALSQSKFDDKLIDLRLFERNCNNLLDVVEVMGQNSSNTVVEYRKRENVIVN